MLKPRLSPNKVINFLTCRMKYRWVYDEQLMPKDKAMPLQVGDVTHFLVHKYRTGNLSANDLMSAEDLVQLRSPENDLEMTIAVAEQALKLLQVLVAKSADEGIKVVSSEMHVEVEEAEFFIYGRIDGLCRTQDGRLWRSELKTTGKMDNYFLSGLKSGLQSGIYHYLLSQTLKEPIQGSIFELLVKTKIPYCEIAAVATSKAVIERALKTFEGVARDIKQGDFYPSGRCFDYGRECDFLNLCNNLGRLDQVKQAFYKRRIKQ